MGLLDCFAGAAARCSLEDAPPPLLALTWETFGPGMKGKRCEREERVRVLKKRRGEAEGAAAGDVIGSSSSGGGDSSSRRRRRRRRRITHTRARALVTKNKKNIHPQAFISNQNAVQKNGIFN